MTAVSQLGLLQQQADIVTSVECLQIIVRRGRQSIRVLNVCLTVRTSGATKAVSLGKTGEVSAKQAGSPHYEQLSHRGSPTIPTRSLTAVLS